MAKYPTGPTSCSEDLSCHAVIQSLTNWAPILVFAFWGFTTCLIIAFFLYRRVQTLQRSIEPVIHNKRQSSCSSKHLESPIKEIDAKEDTRLEMNTLEMSNRDLIITGYENTVLGVFCYILCCVVSLHWLALFTIIIFDTYNQCELGGIDNLCFFGNYAIFGSYDFNAKIFFVIWWLAAIWYIGWLINHYKVRNWFRLPCSLSQAHVVSVWAQEQRQVLSANVSLIIKLVRTIQSRIIPPEKRGHFEMLSVTRTTQGQRFFYHRGQRFLIEGDSVSLATLHVGNTFADFHLCEGGLTQEEAGKRLHTIGKNEIPFKPESLMQTARTELFSLFHVYQLVMYVTWFWNSYLFVATLMAIVVCLSVTITIYTNHQSQIAIAKLTTYVTQMDVFRNQTWLKIDSQDVVPGDVVRVADNWLLPCDLLIIRGSCICDESALTGEARPMQKYQAPNTEEAYEAEGHSSRYTLFSGTRVLQAGSQQKQNVLAVVTATGMSTSKGKLLGAILYPEKMLFKYDEEMPVVFILLLLYAIICFIVSLLFMNRTGSQTMWVTKWIYCIAIINQIMSPLLPVALEVGQLQAVERLKKRGIYSLNPSRIAIAGKIRVFCFDKTGTLTKEGLDFVGVQGLESNGNEICFGSVKVLHKGDNIDHLTRHGLATCHAVSKHGSRHVGNEVEVKMFEAVGWELIECFNEPDIVFDGHSEKIKVLKRHEFDHTRATMSVVVQDSRGFYSVYCKGSFEKLQQLCSPESLPKDYLNVAQKHALDGCYVLSLGYRGLGNVMSLQEILEKPRDLLEMDLQFVSLILFRNEPKVESNLAIKSLKQGEVRPVMVTGDNAQCGYYVAMQCGMVAPKAQIFLGDADADSSVYWVPMSSKVDDLLESLKTVDLFRQYQKEIESGLVELAITGKAFDILRKSNWMEKILFSVRIYARFSPEEKVSITKMYRNRGVIVGMCGDGGNDCGALRVAHAGIALSEAEASVVSPFTSKEKSILSPVTLLLEGRGALHTSFACYKFLIMYGVMFSIFKLCCYWYGVIVCQMGYLFIDGVAVLTLGYAMTLSHPEDVLGKVRPTSSLLSSLNVASVFGVWLINIMFLIGSINFMEHQQDYVKWPARYSHGASWWTLGDNWESTVLFFTMYLQFITSAFVFTFGSTFRKSVFHNWIIMVAYGSLIILMSLVLLLPPSRFTSLWHVASEQFNNANPASPVWSAYQKAGGSPSPGMSFGFRLRLWLLIMGGLATVIVWQKVFAEGVVAKLVAKRFPSTRPEIRV